MFGPENVIQSSKMNDFDSIFIDLEESTCMLDFWEYMQKMIFVACAVFYEFSSY